MELPRCEQVESSMQMLGSLCLATSCSPNGFDPQTIALFFDLVSEDVSISESAAEARDYFLHTFPALQLYSLQGASRRRGDAAFG